MNYKDFDNNIVIWKELFDVDDRTIEVLRADVLKMDYYKYNPFTALVCKPMFIKLISIVERWFSPKLSKKFYLDDEDFIILATCDYNRVKALPLIANSFKYKVFFLPTLTRPMQVRHLYNYYKRAEMKVYFGTLSNDIIKEYSDFLRKNKNLFLKIKCEDTNSEGLLLYLMKRFAIYSIYAKHVFKLASNEKLWIFEQDKHYNIPVINEFRKKGVMTVEMQHGTFLNPITDDRLPLYVDKMICCSEREQSLYHDGGVDIKDIYITGAPLQVLNSEKFTDGPIKYDLLVLLTDTVPKSLERQIVCLEYINEHYKDKKILLRFRPKSAKKDKNNLAEYIKGHFISTGTSLREDLSSSEKVITFSEDAVFELIQTNKRFVVFVNKSDLYGGYLDGLCHSIDEIDECLPRLFSNDTLTDISKYISAFGETDIEIIKQRFEKVISELKIQKDLF